MTRFNTFSQFSAYLIYPFRHEIPIKKPEKRFEQILKMWRPWLSRFSEDSEREKAIDNSYFFLPYIREILFPQVIHWNQMNKEETHDKRLNIQRNFLAEFFKENNLVRLTLKSEYLELIRSPQLRFLWDKEKFQTSFNINWIDAFLFPQHIGFLCIKISLPQKPIAIETCNNFLYYIRLIHPPTLNWTLAEWLVEGEDNQLKFQSRDLVDYLVQVFKFDKKNWSLSLPSFLSRIQNNSEINRYSETYLGQVYGDVFQILSYGCLNEETCNTDEMEENADIDPAKKNLPDILKNIYNHVLYEMSTITLLSDHRFIPSADYVENLFNEHHIALFNNWESMALQNNVIFLGKVKDSFTEKALPENIEFDYLVEYLLASFQKFRISLMLGELIRNEEHIEKNLKESRRLQDEFMTFQNRFWFNEVSRKPIGMEIFSKFQAGLKVIPLFEELKEEVLSLHDHFERKAEKGISTLLNIITFIGLPATLLMEAFSSVLFPHPTLKLLVLSSLAIYAGVGTIWLVWKYFYK